MSIVNVQAHVTFPEQLNVYLSPTFPTIDYIVVEDTTQVSNVKLYFTTVLTALEEANLLNLISDYINPDPPIHTRITRYFTVSTDGKGTDFSDLNDAIVFAKELGNALSAPPYGIEIQIYPGKYLLTASHSINVPMSITSTGGNESTVIWSNTVLPLFVMESEGVTLSGMSIDASNETGILVQSGITRLRNLSFRNALIGINVSGGTVFAEDCDFDATVESGIVVNAGDTSIRKVLFNGCGTAISTEDELTVTDTIIRNCDVGLVVVSGSLIARQSSFVSCGTAIRVQSANLVKLDYCSIETPTLYALDLQTATPNLKMQGLELDRTKLNNPFGATWEGDYKSVSKHVFMEDVHVGEVQRPAKLLIGSGESHLNDARVMTNTQLSVGTWNVITQTDNVYVPFASPVNNNAFYIGYKEKFGGLFITITTPATNALGVWEYYNGTTLSWETIKVMVTDANSPFRNKGAMIWTNPIGNYYVFLERIAQWSQLSLNGTTAYYIRYRFTGGSSFELRKVIVLVNSTSIEKDGTILRFGDARKTQVLQFSSRASWSIQNFMSAREVFYATTLLLPTDLDTSCTVKLSWLMQSTENVNDPSVVIWRVRYACIPEGTILTNNTNDVWFTSNYDSTVEVEQTINVGDGRKLIKVTCPLNLQGTLPGKDTLCIQITRKSADIRNTLNGDVWLINAYMKYVAFMDGASILDMDD
jgi:hypothetical protein